MQSTTFECVCVCVCVYFSRSDVRRCTQDVRKTTAAPATTPEPKQDEFVTIFFAIVGTLAALVFIFGGVMYFRKRKPTADVQHINIRAPTPVSYLSTYRLN